MSFLSTLDALRHQRNCLAEDNVPQNDLQQQVRNLTKRVKALELRSTKDNLESENAALRAEIKQLRLAVQSKDNYIASLTRDSTTSLDDTSPTGNAPIENSLPNNSLPNNSPIDNAPKGNVPTDTDTMMMDLDSSIQDPASSLSVQLSASSNLLRLTAYIQTGAIPITPFVVALDGVWTDPDSTLVGAMTTLLESFTSTDRKKRWGPCVKGASDEQCITSYWFSKRNLQSTFSQDKSFACDYCAKFHKPCMRKIQVQDEIVVGWAELSVEKRGNGALGRWVH